MADFNPNTDQIRGLSMKQPYAQLMLYGKAETRTWDTSYRGWVLICSSKKGYTKEQVLEISGRGNLAKINMLLLGDSLYQGFAIAVGKLKNVSEWKTTLDVSERKTFVKFGLGLHCHIFEDVKFIKPFPIKGKLGYFKLTKEEIKQIKFI